MSKITDLTSIKNIKISGAQGIHVSGNKSIYVPGNTSKTHLWKFYFECPMKTANILCYPCRSFIPNKINAALYKTVAVHRA